MDAVLNTVLALIRWWSGASVLLLDVAIKGVVLLLVASALVISLRNASAATRHLVWCAAVCGLLVLPVVSSIVPKWTVPGLTGLSPILRPVEISQPAPVTVPSSATESAVVPTIRDGDTHVRGERFVAPAAPSGVGRSTVARPIVEFGSAALDWRLVLSGIWLFGAFMVLTWVLGGLLRSWLLVRSACEVTDGPLAWLFDGLSDELDLAGRVTLLQSESGTMPMAYGIRPRIVLPSDANDWTDARLRAVLLHELAHVRRCDFVTQLLARFASTLYWFNPLVWVAVHRMRVERELACDDHVLNTGSKASDYASHLLDIARSTNSRSFASAGGVAMARRSRLSDRLLAVLDDKRRRATVTPRMAVVAWAGAACFVLPVAGAGLGSGAETSAPVVAESLESVRGQFAVEATVPLEAPTESRPDRPTRAVVLPVFVGASIGSEQGHCDWYASGANTSTWMNGEDDDYQVRITMDDCRLEVEIVGEVVFNENETDIVGLSGRGYFEMEEREGRSRRRISIEPSGGGNLERRWFVDGDERPYDDEASAWLSEMIPLLFRRVGLQAEERAGRILDRRGVDGVLQEISQIPSDYIARKYYQVLLTDGDLGTAQLRAIVRQAGNELESDYELAQLLVEVAENHAVDEVVMVVYVEAAGSLESDYEQRRVLDAILSRQDLSQDVAEAMLRLATELESDYELAELLIAILNRHPIDEVLTREFFDAVHTLDSDYEHHRVLKVALEEGAPSQAVLDITLESAEFLDSDYERAELLLEVARLYPIDQEIPSSYLGAAQSLDSDYELCRVLKSLIEHQHLSEDALAVVMDAALTLDSDYELANLLITVAEEHSLEGELRTLFMEAADAISSDYERGRVLAALTPRRGRPN